MRIVLADFISLDGVIQAPGGSSEDTEGGFAHGGWSHPFFDPETMGAAFNESVATTEGLLYGRRTYLGMAAAWPNMAGDPFADHMNSIPKFVASRTLTEADLTWNNSTLLPADDALGAIRSLKERAGGDLQVLGSSTLAHQLIAGGLVDEYQLMIEPITLGGGKRLFPDDAVARTLHLTKVTQTGTGVLICTYRPA